MASNFQKIKDLIFLKLKFAMTSSVATLIDYGLYNLCVYFIFPHLEKKATYAQLIAYSIAVIFNFTLQKRFVFSMERDLSQTFMLAIGISIGGLILSTILITYLVQYPFFDEYQYITKLLVTGIFFFYNFYLKRYAFEKKFI